MGPWAHGAQVPLSAFKALGPIGSLSAFEDRGPSAFKDRGPSALKCLQG